MKVYILIGIILFIFTSCDTDLRTKTETRIVPIDLDNSKTELLSSKVERIEYILLDYEDSLPIVNPIKFIILPNKIYVWDIVMHNVFIFDRNGKVINVIESSGEGPQEFNYINDFIVDGGDIVIFDTQLHKIIRFKENGEFISEERTKLIAENFIDKVGFRLYFMNNNSDAKGFNFVRLAPQKELSAYLPIKIGFEKIRVTDRNGFKIDKFRNEYIFNMSYTYEVAFFNSDGFLSELVYFDLGEAKIKEKHMLNLMENKSIYSFRESQNKVIDITEFFPIKNGYFMPLFRGNKYHLIFLDEDLNVDLQAMEFTNDIDSMKFRSIPWTYGDNELVYVTHSSLFYDDYLNQFGNIKDINKDEGIHKFIAKNQLKLREEKLVISVLKLKK